MDDSVAKAQGGGFVEYFGVGIHHPIDGAVPDSVSADVNAGLMEEPYHGEGLHGRILGIDPGRRPAQMS